MTTVPHLDCPECGTALFIATSRREGQAWNWMACRVCGKTLDMKSVEALARAEGDRAAVETERSS